MATKAAKSKQNKRPTLCFKVRVRWGRKNHDEFQEPQKYNFATQGSMRLKVGRATRLWSHSPTVVGRRFVPNAAARNSNNRARSGSANAATNPTLVRTMREIRAHSDSE